jgi:hypothetical protein
MALTADEAAYLPAPKEGELNALAVTATASAVQDTAIQDGRVWYTFIADGDGVYITFGKTTSVTDPDDTATGSGNAVTWLIPAGTSADYLVDASRRYFKAKCAATETSTLRYRRSG